MGIETSSDYYEILQVSPEAEQEVIERVFRLLAKRYHPDNKRTGDARKFAILVKAYRVLSDPEKRATYDEKRKPASVHQESELFNAAQSRDPAAERRINQVILLTCYRARRMDPMKPGIGIVELEKLVGLPGNDLEFYIWYLKEKGWIQRLETGEFAVTASGVDEVVANDLKLRKDRLLSLKTEKGL